jgi:hypothetical protein
VLIGHLVASTTHTYTIPFFRVPDVEENFLHFFATLGPLFLFFIHPTPFLNHSSCYPFLPQQPTLVHFLTLMEHPDGRLQQQYLIQVVVHHYPNMG